MMLTLLALLTLLQDDTRVIAVGSHVIAAEGNAKQIVVVTPGAVRVYDAADTKELRVVETGGFVVTACASSRDGKVVATVGGQRQNAIKIWDAIKGAFVRELPGHEGGTDHVGVSGYGDVLVSAGRDMQVKIWDPRKGTELRQVKDVVATAMALSTDGKMLVVSHREGTLRLWSPQTATELRKLVLPGDAKVAFETVAVSSDGRIVAAGGGADGKLHFWEGRTGKHVKSLTLDQAVTIQPALSSDGDRVVAVCAQAELMKVLDWKKGEVLALFATDGPTRAVFHPDGLLTSSAGNVAIRSLTGPRVVRVLDGKKEGAQVTDLAASADGRWIATATNGEIRIWDATTGAFSRSLGSVGATSIAFSADGKRLVSACTERTLRVFDVESGKAGVILTDFQRAPVALACTADGKLAATGESAAALRIWDLEAGKEKLAIHRAEEDGNPHPLAFRPDGKRIVEAGPRTLKCWGAEAGAEVFAVKEEGGFASAAFSPDGASIACSRGGAVELRDAESGAVTASLAKDVKGGFSTLEFSADGTLLAASGPPGNTTIWDVKSAKVFRVLPGTPRHFALLPDGKRIVFSQVQGTVHPPAIWRIRE